VKRFRRILIWFVLTVAGLVAAGAIAVYAISEHKLNQTYQVPSDRVAVPADAAAVARGAHLFKAVGTCALCHAEDGGGTLYADLGLVGVITGPNLTRGRGGLGVSLTDADFVRAIRYGVRRDGTSLIVMPSEVFTHLSDDDLGGLIAFIRQLPPVDRELPQTKFGPMGRVLLALGKLNILVAPKTFHDPGVVAAAAAPSIEYGRYLAQASGCHGCHGTGLSGGRVAGPPDLPLASNLTPAGLAAWSEADFVRALREGRRPDGSAINEFMPWRGYGAMTDSELRALWLYLRSVPPRATGTR
jgi:mono/diheme cytochrome c family protein